MQFNDTFFASKNEPRHLLNPIMVCYCKSFHHYIKNCYSNLLPLTLKFYILAHVRNEEIMQSVLSEKDVILGNVQESYKHLSYKHLMGLSWSTSR